MTVRAKFRVEEVGHTTNGANIRLSPVTSGSEENKAFFKWTPSGEIKLGIVSESAASEFKPGEEFYVDFIKA